jgi:membrane fusion protein (multidrug efflux system)
MPATFSRTLRSLETDGSGRRGILLLGVGLLAAWSVWLVLGRVTVYQTTDHARLEVGSSVHPIATPVGGRVVETRLVIGRDVAAGEVLVVLDAEAGRRALEEARARRRALATRREALLLEIAAVEAEVVVGRKARAAAAEEVQAQIAEAEARANLARLRAETSVRLRSLGATSEAEYNRDRTQAEATRAAVHALRASETKRGQDRELQESERRTRLATLGRDVANLDGDAAVEEAEIRRLEHDIALRSIRAPVSGRVGEAAEVHPGSVVQPADRLGAVVPRDPPRAVAFFPAGAVGRIRPGQPARLRLEGYPWTQYGTVAASVREVGNEPSGGLIRVEFTLAPDPSSAIPLGHGLPGTVEVEVEQVPPAVLLLRAAGQYLAPPNRTPLVGPDTPEQGHPLPSHSLRSGPP